eukprot:TRINITY_DN2848_c0_g1_i1.p1 TRINITY_DN2848_c0_g1~~TRINITY_DN2848_c0_g1_i1.p1  ORF type:complete len:1075 (+),score=184.88 TRINITY_DN2848_c0_g1_i1:150-3374(+)
MKKSLFSMLVLLFVGLQSVLAQSREVSGVVTSADDGLSIPGVSVIVKGTTIGTTTDFDGKYSLNVPEDGTTLVFSFVGMTMQEVAITSTTINVVMESETIGMDEVVVTAMGITREKKSLGYASQEVKSDELARAKVPDVNNALVGKVSGVRFLGGSGANFDSGEIRLRGTSSLNAKGNAPIYVVDGVITSFNAVNMDDVASLNVLKGPAATALYGYQGGNGAIVITTKSANTKEGSSSVEFSHTLRIDKMVNHADYQNEYGGGNSQHWNTYNWSEGEDPALKALDGKRYYNYAVDESWGPKMDGEQYIPYYAWDKTDPGYAKTTAYKAHPDNVEDLFKTGVSNNTNIAFSKAGEGYSTRVSFSNVDWKGVIPNSKAVRRFFSVNTKFDLSDKLHLNVNYKYAYRKDKNPGVEGYGGTGNAIYTYSQWFQRNLDINRMKSYKRPDGSFRTWNINSPQDPTPAYHDNPFALFHEINREKIRTYNVLNSSLTYDLADGLKASINFNGTFRNYREDNKVPMGLLETPSFDTRQYSIFDVRTQANLSYNKYLLDDKLSVTGNLYAEERSYRYDNLKGFTRDGLTVDKFYNLDASTGKPGGENRVEEYKTRSLFGTASFGWDNKYYLDLSLRNDWDSKLPEGNNSYLYGGVSTAVILTELLPKNDILTFMKLRGSIAQVGSTMDVYSVNESPVIGDKYGDLTNMRLNRNRRDPNLKPTISTSLELGTEFQLFNGRMFGDLNYYRRNSKDQIIDIDVAGASGYTTTKINAGKILNEGFEISLGGSIVKTKDWEWTLSANWSSNKNEVVELSDFSDQYQMYWQSFGDKIYLYAREGRPVGDILSTAYARNEDGKKILYDGFTGSTARYNGVPKKSSDKLTYLGNAMPKAFGGASTIVNYKGFTFSAAVDYQYGGKIVSISNRFGKNSGLLDNTVGNNDKGNPIRNAVVRNADGTYADNTGGIRVEGVVDDGNGGFKDVVMYADANTYFHTIGSRVESQVYKSDYVKLREIGFSYQFKNEMLDKFNVGLKDLKLGLTVNNPWLIYSAVPNIDPSEAGGANRGYVEMGQMSSVRSYAFTVSCKF